MNALRLIAILVIYLTPQVQMFSKESSQGAILHLQKELYSTRKELLESRRVINDKNAHINLIHELILEKYGIYHVQPGDTISSIAARFGISTDRLIEMNPDIDDPLRLKLVMLIRVRDCDEKEAQPIGAKANGIPHGASLAASASEETK